MAFHLPLLHYDTTVPLSMFSPLFLASLLTLVSSEAAIKLLNRWFVYHVGFAANSIEVFQNSILVSLICCIVYTQCGTSSSSVLETLITPAPDPLDKTRHAMCAFFFSGHTNSHSKNLPTVLVLWSTAMSMLTLNFALERLTGYRGLCSQRTMTRRGRRPRWSNSSTPHRWWWAAPSQTEHGVAHAASTTDEAAAVSWG